MQSLGRARLRAVLEIVLVVTVILLAMRATFAALGG